MKPFSEARRNPIVRSIAQSLDRGRVQMIVVIVTDDDIVDSRQRFKRHRWRRQPAQPGEWQSRIAIPKNRVRKNVASPMLDEERGMTDPRELNPLRIGCLREPPSWWLTGWREPRLRLVGPTPGASAPDPADLPPQHVKQTVRGMRIQVLVWLASHHRLESGHATIPWRQVIASRGRRADRVDRLARNP